MKTIHETVLLNGKIADRDSWESDISLNSVAKTHYDSMANWHHCGMSQLSDSVAVYSRPKFGEQYTEITLFSHENEYTIEKHIQELRNRINWISGIMYTLSVEFQAYSLERSALESHLFTLLEYTKKA